MPASRALSQLLCPRRTLCPRTNRKPPPMKQYLRLLFPFLLIGFVSSTRAQTGNDNPTGVTGDYNGNITTGGSYDPYTGNAKRFVDDLTVTGSVGAYPLKWTRVLNTRGGGGSLGNGGAWSHSYAWGLWVRQPTTGGNHGIGSNGDPNQYEGPDGMVSFPDGRELLLYTDDGITYRVADNQGEPCGHLDNLPNGNFDWVMADGGRVQFRHPAGSTSGF